MARFYLEADCERSLLDGKTVAIVGFGSQGQAQALNMRDSGIKVIVGLREGSSSVSKAEAEGVDVAAVEGAVKNADVISLLVPDEAHGQLFAERIAPEMKEGASLCVAHGLSVHFGFLKPRRDIDVFMVAPLGAGSVLRSHYLDKTGLPCYVAVHQDYSGRALRIALAYASALGCARAGILETRFKDEAEVDLFGEQAVLCGGISFLLLRAFDVLVEAGYQPEMAYLECVNQLKASADLISMAGPDGLTENISSPALYGMLTRGRRIVGEETKDVMRGLLREIQSGEFVNEWRKYGTRSSPELLRLFQEWNSLRMQQVGRNLRRLMNPASR